MTQSNLSSPKTPPCTLVIFGARGDLTKRLLFPALYNLVGSGLLDDGFRVLGVDHGDKTIDEWKQELSEAIHSFTQDPNAEFNPKEIDERVWAWLTDRLEYLSADFTDAASYTLLSEKLGDAARSAIFYLATAPSFFGPIVDQLGGAGLLKQEGESFRRVIIEKPFGEDLASAIALSKRLAQNVSEAQIYRIDHFLAKEPVQSIPAFRFANGLYEPMWRREYIDHVQITAAETLGVEERGKFYEATGALRDMIPNHLFSVMTVLGMDAPRSFAAEDVRGEKVRFLQALQPIQPGDAVRGQYSAGKVGDKTYKAYREEENVDAKSRIETYAAIKVLVENWRWSNVPFYIRTGKHVARHQTTAVVVFKPAPYAVFAGMNQDAPRANVLTFTLSGPGSIAVNFAVKQPGARMELTEVSSAFSFEERFHEKPKVGYEGPLYGCMMGDSTLFHRDDAIDASWAAVDPVLKAWSASGEPELYAPGSDGPASADALLARDGRHWIAVTG